MLPLVGLRAFEKDKSIQALPNKQKKIIENTSSIENNNNTSIDTIVVPARKEGFERVFLGENRWYAIRIGKDVLQQLKFIAAYQVAPISAITHIAEIKNIEPYGENGKYLVNFKAPAQEIPNFIPFNGRGSQIQAPRYTNKEKLLKAKVIETLWEKDK